MIYIDENEDKNNNYNLKNTLIQIGNDNPLKNKNLINDILTPPDLETIIPFSKVDIIPKPVLINDTLENVWKTFLDFKNVHINNPFHRKIEIVKKIDGYYINMYHPLPKLLGGYYNECSFNLDPNDKNLNLSSEKIYYMDNKRYIMIYGMNEPIRCALRCIYLKKDEKTGKTYFCSWDCISGIAGIFIKLFNLKEFFVDAFNQQHIGLKNYIEEDKKKNISNL